MMSHFQHVFIVSVVLGAVLSLLLLDRASAFTNHIPVKNSCNMMTNIGTPLLFPTTTTTTSSAPSSSSVAAARSSSSSTRLYMGQITQQEAQKGIDKVVAALRKDKEANAELGQLQSVNNVLGFGSPTAGQIAVRFNASFKKGGMGRAAVPLPFGLGQTNQSEGRGVMVGQVKASVDAKTGKVVSCSVFRDLGYGRSFNLKV